MWSIGYAYTYITDSRQEVREWQETLDKHNSYTNANGNRMDRMVSLLKYGLISRHMPRRRVNHGTFPQT